MLPWLLHKKWIFTNVAEFIVEPERYLEEIGSPQSFFVRPDSPLKPFSGRVIQREKLSFEALDYGFYYDDKYLPIIITPASEIGQEWRFVIAGQEVIASSAYEASNREEADSGCPSEVAGYVGKIAKTLVPPDPKKQRVY